MSIDAGGPLNAMTALPVICKTCWRPATEPDGRCDTCTKGDGLNAPLKAWSPAQQKTDDAAQERRWTVRTGLSTPMTHSLRSERTERNPDRFDDWRKFIGKPANDRIFAKFNWRLLQAEFFICSHCGVLYEQNDRPSIGYDDCWDCALADRRDNWFRGWAAMLCVQIAGQP